MKHYDVIVIGGGVVGLSTAYYLGKAGKSVLVLDKGDGTDGCSFGNAGFVSPSHFVPLSSPGIVSQGLRWMMRSDSPFYLRPRFDMDLLRWGWQFVRHSNEKHVSDSKNLLADLSLMSRSLHKEIADELKLNFQERGIVLLCTTNEALHHEIEIGKMGEELGIVATAMTMEEINQLDPDVEKQGVGGVFFPQDAYTDPVIFMAQITSLLQSMDVTVEYGTDVTDFSYSGGKIQNITANSTVYAADQYVMAAGSFSQPLMKKLGLRLLLEGGKGYSVDWMNPVSMPSVSYILVEARVAITPMVNRVRLAGTMEIAGLNGQVNRKRAHAFLRSIQNYFPEYEFEKIKDLPVWAGLRPCSPDGLPYIGRNKKFNNLILATGHAMLGFTLGPVTGLLVKEIALEENTSLEINGLSTNRY